MFGRVAIVGVGMMGGSIALALRERNLARHVLGVEQPTSAEAARALVDDVTSDPSQATDADLIVLAIGVGRIREQIEYLAPRVSPTTLVTDIGSVKRFIAEAGAEFLPERFVPGHPLVGSERSGPGAARADLFTGTTWALTPTLFTDPAATEQVERFVIALGAKPLRLSPTAHDEAVALTSHLPHLLAYALAALGEETAPSLPEVRHLKSGSWNSATRVAQSRPDLWGEIIMQNPGAGDILCAFRERLDILQAAIDERDAGQLQDLLQAGHSAKEAEERWKQSQSTR